MCVENRDFKSKYVIFGSSKKSFTEVNHQNRNKSTFKAEGRKVHTQHLERQNRSLEFPIQTRHSINCFVRRETV